MFDTYNAFPYEKTVTTHAHRAPTDESIKLYEDHLSYAYILQYVYLLNGKEYKGKKTFNVYELQRESEGQFINMVYEALSNDIANVISSNLIISFAFSEARLQSWHFANASHCCGIVHDLKNKRNMK